MVLSRAFSASLTICRRSFEGRLTVLCTAALLIAGASAGPSAQARHTGGVKGTVTDASGGVLPGVMVSAVSADGRTLSTLVTGGAGDFAFDSLPASPIDLIFHLDGFEDARTSVTIHAAPPTGAAVETAIAQQLQLKAMTESVVVSADLPPSPPAPRPVLQPVAAHDPSAVCGPTKPEHAVPYIGTVRLRRETADRALFAAGDEVEIDTGTSVPIRVGDNFIVRRRYPTPLMDRKGKAVMADHSSGLIQIVSVETTASSAVVVYACDEMMAGDYLVRFEPEPSNLPEPIGAPSFDKAVRILFADAGQGVGTTNRMLVIDGGTLTGVAAGQRVTLFRRSRFGSGKPVVVGEAVVVAAQRESATIRVERATDAIFPGSDGDWAAPHHPLQRASQ